MKLYVEDVASQLKISEQYARRIMKANKIKSINENRSWHTTQDEIDKFLESGEYVVNPDDRKRKSNTLPEIVALSFFSGGMGLDIGIKNSGIEPLLACEINKDARATIVANNDEIGLIGDIWQCSPEKIRKYARIPKDKQIDFIFGGPPCQAFSTAGNRKGFEDARGDVFIRYLDIITEMKPRYAVIENVRGLQTTEAVLNDTNGLPVKGGVLHYGIDRLNKAGYTVSFELYNAANFGAPQKRERFVIIAKLGNEKVPYLTPTNSETGEFGLPLWNTLGDAISDIQQKEMTYTEIPKNRREWFKKIPEGGNWKSLSDKEQREAMGRKYYMGGGKTGFFRRLSFSQPSPTLVTVPTMPATDLIHPTELRPLSIEEYARIQGFPDDWKFCGKIQEKYKQIGNAVPIKLGEAIGHTILNDMKGINDNYYAGFKYSRYKNTSDTSFPNLYKKNFEKVIQNSKNEQLLLTF
ncbi:DNA cytosine methyltransferase [Lactococcus laudensis]|uniref:Cytosine-specific methyltransferase n=1 Tax=Pseudolactococcus laudensis TaxID=1494461 RepID=A0A7V8SJQ0_9LACT|nr:DNA cytosine methyltransferase [Lactococcus laudensis]MBA0016558.1 DNA cytosine methyltransferase [Lactococcus laudensis]MBR2763632.1 DNA cytosine methyltransferase [Lactococcus sp.]MBW9281197.1 DNA cytosine methyltransferase [Lactococcus laudensis]